MLQPGVFLCYLEESSCDKDFNLFSPSIFLSPSKVYHNGDDTVLAHVLIRLLNIFEGFFVGLFLEFGLSSLNKFVRCWNLEKTDNNHGAGSHASLLCLYMQLCCYSCLLKQSCYKHWQ